MSAGLPVPEGRFELSPLEPSANRHGSNFLITSHDLQLLPADGKWRFAVRPIQIAVGDPRPLEAGKTAYIGPVMGRRRATAIPNSG